MIAVPPHKGRLPRQPPQQDQQREFRDVLQPGDVSSGYLAHGKRGQDEDGDGQEHEPDAFKNDTRQQNHSTPTDRGEWIALGRHCRVVSVVDTEASRTPSGSMDARAGHGWDGKLMVGPSVKGEEGRAVAEGAAGQGMASATNAAREGGPRRRRRAHGWRLRRGRSAGWTGPRLGIKGGRCTAAIMTRFPSALRGCLSVGRRASRGRPIPARRGCSRVASWPTGAVTQAPRRSGAAATLARSLPSRGRRAASR